MVDDMAEDMTTEGVVEANCSILLNVTGSVLAGMAGVERQLKSLLAKNQKPKKRFVSNMEHITYIEVIYILVGY